MSYLKSKPASERTPRKKRCRNPDCRAWFRPWNSLAKACSPACALIVGRIDAAKKQRRVDAQTKRRLKTRSDVLKEAQAAFNAWIRERDRDKPCISCGNYPDDSSLATGSRVDAGHYRSIGANPELRFEPLNCHRQCVRCNQHLSGNVVNYRINLRQRIGDENLSWLEGFHEPKNYTKQQLIEIRDRYRFDLKRIKRNRELESA